MTHGFQQQDPAAGFSVRKSAPLPQHGQKPAPVEGKLSETRFFAVPKPGR